ncbi:suppressor of kinetochore protein mutant [Perkinsus olseni]|uniref:Suppressor of kinetochore protein mutant n=1 Tax=Perkinsus olseni TaxID=32597 RepID=A0A7J6MES5_PEROL|nr:suppressor of kinetochore protein mutant [Perkinsus olseni]KAF4669501.1 suppressor of kinetochore protein mutant [Perkinsus olseni]
MATRILSLRSKDGELVQISAEAAKQCDMLSNYLDGSSGENSEEFPVPGVNSRELKNIVEYLEYHNENGAAGQINKPLRRGAVLTENGVCKWDAEFVNKDVETEVFDLMLAANYMLVRPLVLLCCAKIASWVSKKTPDDIIKYLGLPEGGLTTEQQIEQLRKASPWCSDAKQLLEELENEGNVPKESS